MADFARVLAIAKSGVLDRNDYPAFASFSIRQGDDRIRFVEYLERINRELDTADAADKPKSEEAIANG